MALDLPRKYRPRNWGEVVGHKTVLKSLQSVIARKNTQTFLLSGPSGTGKTTLARLIAHYMGCKPEHIMEVDGATYTGIDDMRELKDMVRYRPLSESGDDKRVVILDECHRASKQAWDSLLKATEEPPPHLIWIFCTTEPGKIPRTLKTRAQAFALKEVDSKELTLLVEEVAEAEKIKLAEGVLRIIVKEAQGSPRQALRNLEQCLDASGSKEAAKMIESAVDSEPVLELCRFLANGKGSWARAMSLVKACGDATAESIRIQIVHYLAKAAIGRDEEDEEAKPKRDDHDFFLSRLTAFEESYNATDGYAPLLLSIGRCLRE